MPGIFILVKIQTLKLYAKLWMEEKKKKKRRGEVDFNIQNYSKPAPLHK